MRLLDRSNAEPYRFHLTTASPKGPRFPSPWFDCLRPIHSTGLDRFSSTRVAQVARASTLRCLPDHTSTAATGGHDLIWWASTRGGPIEAQHSDVSERPNSGVPTSRHLLSR